MTVRALALSGGGARGSFQMGALAAIYDVYGFRPDVVAGTSVGSVNGIKLAVARPPAVNDPAVILASVAAGNPDSGLTALRALEALWEGSWRRVSSPFSRSSTARWCKMWPRR